MIGNDYSKLTYDQKDLYDDNNLIYDHGRFKYILINLSNCVVFFSSINTGIGIELNNFQPLFVIAAYLNLLVSLLSI